MIVAVCPLNCILFRGSFKRDLLFFLHAKSLLTIPSRCPTKKNELEQTVRIVNGDAKRKRFTLASLKFVKSDSVYVHCVVFVCNRTSTDDRCTGGCPRNRVDPPRIRRDVEGHRARRDIMGRQSDFIKLDVGPIQLKQDKGKYLFVNFLYETDRIETV